MRGDRLATEALLIGYAMSRLDAGYDAGYLAARGHRTWRAAFAEAGAALGKPPATLKNLRDEFDPVHANSRRGWLRPGGLRADRQRVIGEMAGASGQAVLALVDELLRQRHDGDALDGEAGMRMVVEMVAEATGPSAAVAERLHTGRLAEAVFLANTHSILGLAATRIIDLRQAAAGYDFGVDGDDAAAVEVKGVRQASGGMLFTDLEWRVAAARRSAYAVVVISDLDENPKSTVIRDPVANLPAACRATRSLTFSWSAYAGRDLVAGGLPLAPLSLDQA